jgi:hypothetical protein
MHSLRLRRMTVWRAIVSVLIFGFLSAALPADARKKKKRANRPTAAQKQKAQKPAPKAPSRPATQEPDRLAPAGEEPPTARNVAGEESVTNRIEFDERLIAGQTAKPGAVRLFERRDSDLKSIVQARRDLRSEVVRSILGRQPEAIK